ncbi:MAG: CehA/McbA family metallohydrolase [Planctomycetota bacterium]
MQLKICRYLPIVLCMLAIGDYSVLAQYHVFWGDVHGHTSISDGKGSLDDFFTYARDTAKLDFVIVTDHDFGNAPPWRMPREKWKLTQDAADTFTVNSKFVAIAGYEWTSQPKYWKGVGEDAVSERLFPGPPKFYNHKNVYFLSKVDYLFSAKDPAYMSPDLLAEAVQKHRGLIHNAHPTDGQDGRDQFDYSPSYYTVISNSEIGADTIQYDGKTYQVNSESILRDFLNRGGKSGFVKGTDSHEGKSAVRTAVLARELTRKAIFEAFRNRRNYAVSNARIVLEFKINEHDMGEEIEIEDKPHIAVNIKGTDKISEVAIVRDGAITHSIHPGEDVAGFQYTDNSFEGNSYYYVRVTQVDTDEQGNHSLAWSSPIWVKRK